MKWNVFLIAVFGIVLCPWASLADAGSVAPNPVTLSDYMGPVRYHRGFMGSPVIRASTPISGPRRRVEIQQDLPIDLNSIPTILSYGDRIHVGTLLEDGNDGFSTPRCFVDFSDTFAFAGLGFWDRFYDRYPTAYKAGTSYQLGSVVVRSFLGVALGHANRVQVDLYFGARGKTQPSGLNIACVAESPISKAWVGHEDLAERIFDLSLEQIENGLTLNGDPVFKFVLDYL